MNYDEKERLMIAHYFGLLAENNFTEYDILGFLMVLRREMDKEKYKYIHDFSNLIAHRNRDKGVAMDAIKGAIDSNYEFIAGTRKSKAIMVFRMTNGCLSGKILLPTFLSSFLMKPFTILQSVCFRLPKTPYTLKRAQKRAKPSGMAEKWISLVQKTANLCLAPQKMNRISLYGLRLLPIKSWRT